jgi:hypothetical protein
MLFRDKSLLFRIDPSDYVPHSKVFLKSETDSLAAKLFFVTVRSVVVSKGFRNLSLNTSELKASLHIKIYTSCLFVYPY